MTAPIPTQAPSLAGPDDLRRLLLELLATQSDEDVAATLVQIVETRPKALDLVRCLESIPGGPSRMWHGLSPPSDRLYGEALPNGVTWNTYVMVGGKPAHQAPADLRHLGARLTRADAEAELIAHQLVPAAVRRVRE